MVQVSVLDTKDKMTKLKLGKKYKDSISGFVGTATGVAEYLYGCRRVQLEGDKDGKPEDFWFDEQRLEGVSSTAVTGGPQNDPSPSNPS